MRPPDPSTSIRTARPGKVLVMTVLMMPVLLGMTGLVIDGGMLMATHRQVQNTADAAALAAAMDLYRGAGGTTAVASAQTFVTNNGLNVTLGLNAGATNTINIPPATGPHAGNGQYAEAIVTTTAPTFFIQVLSGSSTNSISARSVAGYEPVGAGEGAIVLDPTAAPGLSVSSNNSRLIVRGSVVVNSQGSGVDQYNQPVSGSYSQPAVSTGGPNISPAPIVVNDLQVVGGVDTPDNVRFYDPAFGPTNFYDSTNQDRPIFARGPIAPDPLLNLATPTTSNGVQNVFPDKNGVNQASPQNISIGNSDTVTLKPGIYQTIGITGGTVTMNPGIYVVGVNATGGGNRFSITGGTVTANGVMVYNTGNDYTTSGSPDSSDGNSSPSKSVSSKFGGITINGGTVTMTPISDTSSPFFGMLFYQRRWNTTSASIAGNSSNLQLGPANPTAANPVGTIYAKWANFQLSGTGKFNSQFVVGSMSISGGAAVTINSGGKSFGRANVVFLVE